MNQNREGVEERKKKERITTFCVNQWREKATQQNTQIYWFSSLEKNSLVLDSKKESITRRFSSS